MRTDSKMNMRTEPLESKVQTGKFSTTGSWAHTHFS